MAETQDLWNPYRELYTAVNRCLNHAGSTSELENNLRRNKQSFISLLKNLPKNARNREEIKKGMEDGITVKGIGHQILSRELYQETIIVSDMFDLNEYVALDLLCTAQIQMPYYPGLPRGLVAVLLYYDGRKYLVSTLKLLIHAKSGVSWTFKLNKEVQQIIDTYMDHLFENGLLNKILELLRTLDLSKEMEKLQTNLALGGPKHRKQVTDIFMSTKVMLAECVFLWSKQSGLDKISTIALIQHLKTVKLEEEASGKLDNVTMYLLMSLLNAIDVSILHSREDGEELVQKLPVLSESDFITSILKELNPSKAKWKCGGLQSLATFAFAVCLSSMRMVPQGMQQVQNTMDYEDEFVDAAITMKVFEFMTNVLMENDMFYEEEYIYTRVHYLFVDFIVQMYPKVKELRIKADEIARTIQAYVHEGLEVPVNVPRDFEQFLLALAKMYIKDPLNLKLVLNYWVSADTSIQVQTNYRNHPRYISLFKFIRLAGEMVPPSLFVSYLSMLSSLSGCQQAARICFNMLKTVSALNNNMTWDHFFMSFNQYYGNLKQEAPSGNEVVYRHSRVYNRGIVPQEIEGLHAVLKLIQSVSDNDDFSRLAFCEHPGWAPLTVLLGLVSCSIPIPLKADLLRALASLCKSPECATQMWNNLEASQILVTIPTTSSYQPRGIQTELDEVESRIEEYPLTRAWLTLLDTLTDYGIPRSLGAGPRKPGFDPYLTFIVNSIFLKFNLRSYRNPQEKWQVAALCLKLFTKFLEQYEPEGSDFPNISKPNEFNSPPGFHLMLQLHTKSEIFDALLFIIGEGNKHFDSYAPDEKYINDSTQYAFRIIHHSFILQPKFFQLSSSTNCPPMLLKKMNELLLTNSRAGRPDHVLNIMKYLIYQEDTPKQSFLAVKILTHLTSSPVTHSQIMNILLSSHMEKDIRTGFVECMDRPLDPDLDIIAATKKAIWNLFTQCLSYNAPSLTHFMFGFDLQKGTLKTVFQLPGVLNFPRTCLHSLFALLRQNIFEESDVDSSLIETTYHMLYTLCSSGQTAEPVLRYIRTLPNFYKDHVTHCYKNCNIDIIRLNQLSWILKVLAIELRVACQSKQIVNLKKLTFMLVGLPVMQVQVDDAFDLKRMHEMDASLTIQHLKHENFLIKLITSFDFAVPEVVSPKWTFFEESSLDTYLASCQTDSNPKLIDIKKLHRNLVQEVTNAQGSAVLGQRQAMMDEIQKVLLHALNVNNNRKTIVSITKFVDAWRQVAQVLVIYLPNEIISHKDRALLHIFLIENVLRKAISSSLLPEVGYYLSSTIVVLLERLKNSYVRAQKMFKATKNEEDDTALVIETNMSSMKAIFNSVLEWIIESDNKSQKLRINLYGALVAFLQLINLTSKKTDDDRVDDSLYVSRLDSTKYRLQDEVASIYVTSNILASVGEKLIEFLCYDSIGGNEICKMLAMSSFGLLISLSGNTGWIVHLFSRGYLKSMMESILESDKDLRGVLEPAPDNKEMKLLYLYDVQMALFIRLANTRIGAEILLEQKILAALASMKVFNYHPEITKQMTHETELFLGSIESRYLQIWEPTLHLCNALLTSLGTDHQMAIMQIMNFLLCHLDVVELVLRSGSPMVSVEALKELSVLTSVIARSANNDLVSVLQMNSIPRDSQAHLFRIQKLMLALVPRFVLMENAIQNLLCESDNDRISFQTSERLSYAININANLMLYSRNLIQNHGIDHSCVGVIFQPNLDAALIGLGGNKQPKNHFEHTPSLGVIVYNLINTVAYFHKEKSTLDYLKRKVKEIPELGTIDLKEYIQQESFDVTSMREEALELVSSKLAMKKHNINHCLFIIEHSMYIIWAHLDYYMRRAIPKASNFGLKSSQPFNPNATLASATEAIWKVSTDDISNLKQGLVSIFNDKVCRQLVETSEKKTDLDTSIVEVLLRELKCLIQFVPVK